MCETRPPVDAGLFISQEEEGQGGDQDQEEKRWNKRTQQMLHGLQVKAFVSYLFYILACFITLFSKMFYEFNTPIFSSSVLWLKRVQTQLACLTCAEITTGSRRLPSFTVSWFLRSSKPLRSLSLSPTATSSPPLDQDSILFRHWKTHTLCLQQTSFFYYN